MTTPQDVLKLLEQEQQDRVALLAKYRANPGRKARPGQNQLERVPSATEGHRPSSPTAFEKKHGQLVDATNIDSTHKAALQQILDVLDGDVISLGDIVSAFLVYKVSSNSEDIEVVLRDYTDGERDSLPRQKIEDVYWDVKKLAAEADGADYQGGSPVVGENVLVLVAREYGKDLVAAKVVDVISAEGQRTIFKVQMPDGTESSLVRSNIFTLREASVPHASIVTNDILPETKELRPISAEELHQLGIQPEDFPVYSDFVLRHAYRKSLFCRNWVSCTERTEFIELSAEDINAVIVNDQDHLQETVAPQIASVMSLFAMARHGGGSEVSGGSNRRSDGGRSGVSGTHRSGSERGSHVGSHISGATYQTKHSVAGSKSQSSANKSNSGSERSPRGSEGGGSQHSGSAAGSRHSSKQKSDKGGGGSRFRRQHGLIVDIDTCNSLDTILSLPIMSLEDDLIEARKNTQTVTSRAQNSHHNFNLNREEAAKVGLLLGTLCTAELVKEFQQKEDHIRNQLLEAKRAAGRRHIESHGMNFDKEAELEKVEEGWQEIKVKIEEEIKQINFEIAKIEDNIYEETAKELAAKMAVEKSKKKNAEARLEHEKSSMKSRKKTIKERDEELEASYFPIFREEEEMERILFLVENRTRELLTKEIERRVLEIRESEIVRAQQHLEATIWVEVIEPTPREYFEMACRVQRGVRCYRARATFARIVDFWGGTTGTINFKGAVPPLDKNFVLSDGPEIWNYYRDYGLCIKGPDGKEHIRIMKRYTSARQVQISTPFPFHLSEGTQYSLRFPDDPETVIAAYRDLFHREDIHSSGFIGLAQLNRALISVGVTWDQEDLDELITFYSKIAPKKLSMDEYLSCLQDENLRGALKIDLLRAKKNTLPGVNRAKSQLSGPVVGGGGGKIKGENQKMMRRKASRNVLSEFGSTKGLQRLTSSASSGSAAFSSKAPSQLTRKSVIASQSKKADEIIDVLQQHKIGGKNFGDKTGLVHDHNATENEVYLTNEISEQVSCATQDQHLDGAERHAKIQDPNHAESIDSNGSIHDDDGPARQECIIKARWALFGSMQDFSGVIQRVEPPTALQGEGAFLVTNNVEGKIAVVDAIRDENGRVDFREGASYYQQAVAVQEAGALACIIVNMEGARNVSVKALTRTLSFDDENARDSDVQPNRLDKTGAPNESSNKQPDFGKAFPMPTNEEAANKINVTIPVLMVEYSDKRHLTDKSIVTHKLVDESRKVLLHSWPFRAMSLQDISDDVHKDRLCVSNLLMEGLHGVQLDLLAVGSTMFDPGVWTREELLEALANNKWKGQENKEYSLRDLVRVAKEMNCQHPSITSLRIVEVVLESARHLPMHGQTGLPPGTYVSVQLESFEAKSKTYLESCEPTYHERLRLFVQDSQMRKDELTLARQKFDIVTQDSALNRTEIDGDPTTMAPPGLQHLMPADLPLMFADEMFGGEDDIKLLMEEYDVNHNGYLEWEEFVNLYDDLVPRPTNLDINLMRMKTEEEDEDVCIGSVFLSLDEIEQGQLIVRALVDRDGNEVCGSGDKIATLSLRIKVFNLSSETGISQDPATDAISLLAKSKEVKKNLGFCKTMNPANFPASIMLRQYNPEIAHNPERHFRVFVHDNQITAITQRHHEVYFYKLHVGHTKHEYKVLIIDFFWTSVSMIMRDEAYTRYVFDVFVHLPKDANGSTPYVKLLGFSAFDKSTDAGLYKWGVNRDLGILTMGKVFPPSNIPELQPNIALANGQVVPNVDIRVRSEPIQDPLYCVSSLWKKKLRKLIEKLEAEYEGREQKEDMEPVLQEKVSMISCNPSELLNYFIPSKTARGAENLGAARISTAGSGWMFLNEIGHSNHKPVEGRMQPAQLNASSSKNQAENKKKSPTCTAS